MIRELDSRAKRRFLLEHSKNDSEHPDIPGFPSSRVRSSKGVDSIESMYEDLELMVMGLNLDFLKKNLLNKGLPFRRDESKGLVLGSHGCG